MIKQFMHSLPGRILSFLVILLLTALVVVGVRGAFADDSARTVRIVGWAEELTMTGIDRPLDAKLDTGATTASINAEILATPDDDVEAGGIVKFNFVDANGNKTLFERPLTRWVTIKGDGRRPVVNMSFCLDGVPMKGEVTLAERDEFDYAILVGRNLLEMGRFAVDSAETYATGDASTQACTEENNA